MRILYLTGARSDYGLMRRTLRALNDRYQLSIIVTGMHLLKRHGLTVREVQQDGLRIWKRIPLPDVHDSVADMKRNMQRLENRLSAIVSPGMFDVCIVEGDRYEMLAMARVAKKRGLWLVHQGGGDASGGIDDAFRREITRHADVHLAGNKRSEAQLRNWHIPKTDIHMFGEPGLDDLAARDYTQAHILRNRYQIAEGPLLLCTMHPDTLSRVRPRNQIAPLLQALKTLKVQTVLTYPNNDPGGKEMIDEIEALRGRTDVHIFPSLSRADFLGILTMATAFVGNSSAGLTEASFTRTPFILIGDRQRGRLADGNVISVANDRKAIIAAITSKLRSKAQPNVRYVYGKGRFTHQFLRLLKRHERDR